MRPSFVALCALAALFACGSAALAQQGRGGPPPPSATGELDSTMRTQPMSHDLTIRGMPAHAPAGGQVYYEGIEADPILTDGSTCGPGGCNHCGRFGPAGCGPFGQGCLSGLYIRGEYLAWSMRGMELPAIATTSPEGTAAENAGVIGEAGTDILFGDDRVNSDVRSGGRITVGWWFDPCRRLGMEADYFSVEESREGFRRSSDGTRILGRPFFDVTGGTENSSLVSFPGLIAGQIDADVESSFDGAGVRAVYNLCCGDGTGTSCITCCPVTTGYRFDVLVGYRHLNLDDRISITEDSTSLSTAAPGSFLIRDRFDTENEFDGVDFGTTFSWCKGCWSLDMLSKMALGRTRSRTEIRGSTVITEGGNSETFTGGLLAQRTNIGIYDEDEFAVVPELGLNLGYQINPCWRATVGYTFIYWSRVARAGDQIDRNLNPDLLPPEDVAVTTNLRPEFNQRYTDFWAQGFTAGLEGSW